MSVPAVFPPPAGSYLAGRLTRDAVLVHLSARVPELLARIGETVGGLTFEQLLAAEAEGTAAEIVAIAGDPSAPDLSSPLRLRALSLGVAASIESAAFPEQQLGEGSRSAELRTRYLSILAMLRERFPTGVSDGGGTTPGTGTTSPYWSGLVAL